MVVRLVNVMDLVTVTVLQEVAALFVQPGHGTDVAQFPDAVMTVVVGDFVSVCHSATGLAERQRSGSGARGHGDGQMNGMSPIRPPIFAALS